MHLGQVCSIGRSGQSRMSGAGAPFPIGQEAKANNREGAVCPVARYSDEIATR